MRKNNRFIKNILVSFALVSSLVITQPIYVKTIQAAEIEDCDLDGYDDHTGNPVPWIGFDSTKGEAIPGDWDHSTIYKSVKAYQDAHSKKEEPKEKSGSSSETKSSAAGKNTVKENSSNSGNQNTSSKQSSSVKKNSTAKKSTPKKEKVEPSKKTEEKETVTTEETTEETTETKKKHKKKHKKAAVTKEDLKQKGNKEQDVAEETEQNEESEIAVGSFDINEADGSIIHAGSKLIVSGADFEGNIEGIEIEIHSNNHIHLGYANTLEDGSFESQVSIPETLPAGNHEIVLKYQGSVIATKNIQVGEKVADTFLSALTVGFTGENQGLIPGLLLLTGLFAAGILTLLSGRIAEKIKS